MESCPTQALLPWVGPAAEKVIRDRYITQPRSTMGREGTIRRRPNVSVGWRARRPSG
ncbi:MAG: hypothetical protein ACQESR_10230 [Planctomycetota bacterium]